MTYELNGLDPSHASESSKASRTQAQQSARFEELTGTDQNDQSDTGGLFDGDRGELNLAERKTLVILLKNRYLSAEKYPREWKTLRESRLSIETRLNELFQVLVLDEERRFAYKRSASPEAGGAFPTLLRDRHYTLEETVLLVELRERYAREWSSGAVAVHVDRDELLAHLVTYRRPDATNRVLTRRREDSAIDGLTEEGVLIKVDGDAERLRVAPIINAVLTVEKLRELRQWLVSDVEGSTTA